jgi:putative flippase GtrA
MYLSYKLAAFTSLINYLKINRLQLVRYLFITLFIFIFSIFLFYILYNLFGIAYQLTVFFVYVATVVCHFTLHRNYTFGASAQNVYLNTTKYSLLLLLNYLLTLVVAWLIILFNLSPYLTFCLSPPITALSSFVFFKHFVFKP